MVLRCNSYIKFVVLFLVLYFVRPVWAMQDLSDLSDLSSYGSDYGSDYEEPKEMEISRDKFAIPFNFNTINPSELFKNESFTFDLKNLKGSIEKNRLVEYLDNQMKPEEEILYNKLNEFIGIFEVERLKDINVCLSRNGNFFVLYNSSKVYVLRINYKKKLVEFIGDIESKDVPIRRIIANKVTEDFLVAYDSFALSRIKLDVVKQTDASSSSKHAGIVLSLSPLITTTESHFDYMLKKVCFSQDNTKVFLVFTKFSQGQVFVVGYDFKADPKKGNKFFVSFDLGESLRRLKAFNYDKFEEVSLCAYLQNGQVLELQVYESWKQKRKVVRNLFKAFPVENLSPNIYTSKDKKVALMYKEQDGTICWYDFEKNQLFEFNLLKDLKKDDYDDDSDDDNEISDLFVSPKGKYLFVIYTGGEFDIMNFSECTLVVSENGGATRGLILESDDKDLYISDGTHGTHHITVYDLKTGDVVLRVNHEDEKGYSDVDTAQVFRLLNSGKYIFSSDIIFREDGDKEINKTLLKITDIQSGKEVCAIEFPQGFNYNALSLAQNKKRLGGIDFEQYPNNIAFTSIRLSADAYIAERKIDLAKNAKNRFLGALRRNQENKNLVNCLVKTLS